MAKPARIPCEKFVLGGGNYCNWLPLVPRVTASHFEIAPAPIPKLTFCVHGIAIVAVFTGMCVLLWRVQALHWQFWVPAVAIFGTLTAAGTLAATAAIYRSRQRKGPVFRYEFQTGEVTLPDLRKAWRGGCHFSFASIYSPFFSESRSNGEKVAELQLVVEGELRQERFALARTNTPRLLAPLLRALHQHVPFPLRVIKHRGVFRNRIEESDYSPK